MADQRFVHRGQGAWISIHKAVLGSDVPCFHCTPLVEISLSPWHCSSQCRDLRQLHAVLMLTGSHPLAQVRFCAPWGGALGCDLFGRCTPWCRICRGYCRPRLPGVRAQYDPSGVQANVRLRVWWGRKQVRMPKGVRIRCSDSDKCRIYGRVTTALGVSCSCGGKVGWDVGGRFRSTITFG